MSFPALSFAASAFFARNLLQSIHQAFDIPTHLFAAEIDQQAKFHARETQISEDLFFVCAVQGFDRLNFQKNQILDDQIGPKPFFKVFSLKMDGNRALALNSQTLLTKHVGKKHLINRLQQPRPQLNMQSERFIHHNLRNLIFPHYPIFASFAFFARDFSAGSSGKSVSG